MSGLDIASLVGAIGGNALDTYGMWTNYRRSKNDASRMKGQLRADERRSKIMETENEVGAGVEGGRLAQRRHQLVAQPYERQIADINRAQTRARHDFYGNTLKSLLGGGGNAVSGLAGLTPPPTPEEQVAKFGTPVQDIFMNSATQDPFDIYGKRRRASPFVPPINE